MTREEAINEIKSWAIPSKKGREVLETLIPELCESEDERIRKEIIKFLRSPFVTENITDEKIDPWIAYLEKLKEPIDPFDTKLFQDGVKEGRRLEREDIKKEQKPLSTEETELNSIAFLEQMGYTCIPPGAKPAEWSEDKFPKDIEKDATQFCFDKGFNITPYQAKEIATHYLMVGHNFGYVEGRKNAHIPAKELGLPSSMDFKQEWSEEDKVMLNNIIWSVHLKSINPLDEMDDRSKYKKYEDFLKSLPERFALQSKQEWSENDERMLSRCVKSIESSKQFADADTFKKAKDKEIDWLKNKLKSLRPSWKPSEQEKGALRTAIHVLTEERNFPKATAQLQNILDAFEGKESRKDWKPSEEHFQGLRRAITKAEKGSDAWNSLTDLYEQLKKL